MIIETGSQLTLFLKFGIITFFILNLTSYISVCPVAIRRIKFFVHQSIGWFSIEFHYWMDLVEIYRVFLHKSMDWDC